MSDALFGDYSLTKARGRWAGTCYRCGHSTKDRPSPGQAEESVRGHLADVHHLSTMRRDVRQTLAWSS